MMNRGISLHRANRLKAGQQTKGIAGEPSRGKRSADLRIGVFHGFECVARAGSETSAPGAGQQTRGASFRRAESGLNKYPDFMRAAFLAWIRLVLAGCSLILGAGLATQTAAADEVPTNPPAFDVTNVLQISRLSSADPKVSHAIHLEGTVWWANAAQGRFVLKDESGAAELEMDLAGQPVQTGQRVRVEGNGIIARRGAGFRIGAKGSVVDNNGIHDMAEKSGTVYLKAGRHPIRVDWFNGVEKYGLEVDYEGPGLPRQKIPDTALFRMQTDATIGASNWVNGLDYRCYEVTGEVLPDFGQLTAIKTGTATNFDLSVMARPEHVGLQFAGFLEVPRDGLYTFHTKSDDGSQLFVGGPSLRLEVIGRAELPAPRQIVIGQTLRDGEDGQWAEVEGKVTFVNEQPDGMKLELSAGADRMRVEIADGSPLPSTPLLNSRIRAVGFCQSADTADGQKVPGVLLVPEYYAQNAGLEQEKWKDLQPAARSSRQLRGDGEARLLQQALNFQEAHNDDLKTTAFADGVWVMFDYNRGYAPDLESSGVMDIFRLPKFSYWFFRSQRDAGELIAGRPLGPVIYIANYWTADSPLEVRVFSNCEEVALYLNGKLVERRRPDTSRVSTHLKHAPFTFKPGRFQPGTLQAVGYIGGREVTRCERRTPGELDGLTMKFDLSGRPFAIGNKDMTFCYASLKDKTGTLIPTARVPVFFGITGPAQLVGDNPIMSEAGTATVLVASDIPKTRCAVYAICLMNEKDHTRILSAAASPDGTKVPDYKIHYTTDGTELSARSPVYSRPVKNAPQLRAAILVNEEVVARADSRTSAPATSDSAVAIAKANAQRQ
jgi:hypothetical protein